MILTDQYLTLTPRDTCGASPDSISLLFTWGHFCSPFTSQDVSLFKVVFFSPYFFGTASILIKSLRGHNSLWTLCDSPDHLVVKSESDMGKNQDPRIQVLSWPKLGKNSHFLAQILIFRKNFFLVDYAPGHFW